MKLTWAERIDAAEKRGVFLERDLGDIGDWNKCFVGEALHAAGVTTLSERFLFCSDIRDSRLVNLGTGVGGQSPLRHPRILMERKDFEGCRERLAEIQARVDELYPPPKIEIPALSEPAKKREKVLA